MKFVKAPEEHCTCPRKHSSKQRRKGTGAFGPLLGWLEPLTALLRVCNISHEHRA